MNNQVPINLSKYTEREISAINLDGSQINGSSFSIDESSQGKTINLNIGVSSEVTAENIKDTNTIEMKVEQVEDEVTPIKTKSILGKIIDFIKRLFIK
ncbi:MAG: hypothetical protein ACRCXA_12255 [Peptostreptococcaceae bacterium]